MGNRWKLAGAMLAGAAVAVPATVLAGGEATSVQGDVAAQTTKWTGKETAPKDWTLVPGDLGNVNISNNAHALVVSAVLAKGKVKFRLSSLGTTLPPGAALFAAKGANSFTFGFPDGCGPGSGIALEWKRAGKQKAVASKLSTLDLNDDSGCF
jgi:hypothetical protein